MTIKTALISAILIINGGYLIPRSQENHKKWVVMMREAQINLLKIDWGLKELSLNRKNP